MRESSPLTARVSYFRHILLRLIILGLARIYRAKSIYHYKIFNAEIHQMSANGYTCRARAVYNDLDRSDILFYKSQCVYQRRTDNNSGTVLIIVKYGYITQLFKTLLYLKATGRTYILKIDASKATRDKIYRPHYLVNVLALYA